MRTTQLGHTGISVTAIGFGAMHLSLEGRPPRARSIEVIHGVLDLGITFIDTADAYCRDESDKHHNERLIAEALQSYPGNTSAVVVATKGGSVRPEGRWERNGEPDHIRRTVRESHEALGGDAPISLWQHHAPDANVPVEDSLLPVREAVQEGLIRYVGVSNYTVEQIERARSVVDIVSVQNQYSLWHRRPEHNGVLAYCEREEITFLPYRPLGGKARAKEAGRNPVITETARRHEVSPQCIVLAWLLARSPCILPIPGSTRVDNVREVVRAPEVNLTPEEIERIGQVTD